MNRRSFIKAVAGGSVLFGSGLRGAWGAGDKVLVVVFLRGGWDGLSVVVPHGEDAYYTLRPTIAIPPPSSQVSNAALDIDGFFGLHPAMTELFGRYKSGEVALMPAVHYASGSRSHFVSQDVIETGVSPVGGNDGWLGRYLNATGTAKGRALSLSERIPRSLAGALNPVAAYPDLSGLYLASGWSDRATLNSVASRAAEWPIDESRPNAAMMRDMHRGLVQELETLLAVGQRTPAAGVDYPISTFGRQLRQAASLVKGRTGVEVITLNVGGWDTHSDQGSNIDGRLGRLLADFSKSVDAFFTDLGGDASRVLLLACTEFGRTAVENGSKGTDHGNASAWMAVGPGVNGGLHLGAGWPGLATEQLIDGRSLNHSIDFRSVYANVLSRHLGIASTTGILSGMTGAVVNIVA